MILHISMLLMLGILSATIHWIIARSVIMRWFWSRATGWAGKLLACPACSGWWISMGLGALGLQPLVATPFHWQLGDTALTLVLTAVLGAFLTPVLQAVLLWGLAVSSNAVNIGVWSIMASAPPLEPPPEDSTGPVPIAPMSP